MARDYNGTTQYISRTDALTAFPLSFACWANLDTIAATAAYICMSISTGSSDWHWLLTDSVALTVAASDRTASVSALANSGGTVTTGSWFHAAGVFNSATDRRAFFNGANKGTNATSKTPAGLNRTSVGVRISNTTSQFLDGRCDVPAVWSVALTDDEIAALARGANPRKIRPQSFWGYWPCDLGGSPEPDMSGNARPLTLTASPPTAAAGPRVRLWSHH